MVVQGDADGLIDEALAAFESVVGAPVSGRRSSQADELYVVLGLESPGDEYRVHVRSALTPSQVPLFAEQLSRERGRHLLVTRHVSAATGALLRERGIPYVDAAGNAWVRSRTSLVYVEGRPAPERSGIAKERERLGAAAWQVAFALLRDPAAAGASVRRLAEMAGVSHGAADAALHALHARGWVKHLGRAGHPVVDRAGLIMAWRTGFSDRLAPRLERYAARPSPLPVDEWYARVRGHLEDRGILVGGELGAHLTGCDVVPASGTLYSTAWSRSDLLALRLTPDPQGSIHARLRFSPAMEGAEKQIVDPILLLAEISTIPDRRLDAARLVLQQRVEGSAS